MTFSTVRRLASDILGIGTSRIRISAAGLGRAAEALTRADVKNLIRDKVFYILPLKGVRSKKDRSRRGRGSRKGTANSRAPGKKAWMQRVRSQRKFWREIIESGALKKEEKRQIYMKIKSGMFRSKKALFLFLKENGLLNAGKDTYPESKPRVVKQKTQEKPKPVKAPESKVAKPESKKSETKKKE